MSLTVLVTALWGAGWSAPSPSVAAPRGGVIVIGDSLTVGTSSAMGSALAQAGIPAVIDAAVGRHTSAFFDEPLSGVRALRRTITGVQPELVVAALGTNDVYPTTTQSAIRNDVTAFVAEARGTRVCWVALHRRSTDAASSVFERANDWYRTAVEATGGCWLTWTPSADEWAGDGIHLTSAGYRRRAGQLADQIAAVLADPVTQPPSAVPLIDVGPPVGFGTTAAARLFDSRDGSDHRNVAAGTDVRIAVSPSAGATSLIVELTMTNPAAAGWMSIWGCGSWPGTSTVNVDAHRTRANVAIVALDPVDPALCIRSSVATDAVIDVLGGLRPGGSPLSLVAGRLLDTRPGRVTALQPVPIVVPATDATAALVTITSVGGAEGYASAGSCDQRPEISNLNFDGPDPVASTTLVGLRNGVFCVWSSVSVGLLVDLVAVVKANGDSLVQPVSQTRVVDTRVGQGAPDVTPSGPIRVAAIIANVTFPGGARAGYFSPSCAGTTSMMNWGDRTTAVAGLGLLTDCLATSTTAEVVIDQIARLVPAQP